MNPKIIVSIYALVYPMNSVYSELSLKLVFTYMKGVLIPSDSFPSDARANMFYSVCQSPSVASYAMSCRMVQN